LDRIESGFGNLHSEFWYGLKPLNCLTSNGTWELRIDFTFANNTRSYLHYNNFEVGPATDNYNRLNISGFTGITPTDPLTDYSPNGQQFTTFDRDNDIYGVVIVHLMDMAMSQADGGTAIVIISTSTTIIS